MKIRRIEITATHVEDGREEPLTFSFGPHLCQSDAFRAPLLRLAREILQVVMPCIEISTDGEDVRLGGPKP